MQVTRKQETGLWHAERADSVLVMMRTSAHGLSEQDVESRLREYGRNLLPEKGPMPLWVIVLRQFVNPLIYILVAAAVFSVIIGEIKEAVFIAAVLAINAVLGAYQELQAE